MRLAAICLALLLLAACAGGAPTSVQPVTVTKTVPVYPPAELYGTTDGCAHGAARAAGTVRDLANALVDERAAVDVCLGDRAALRQWRADSEAH